jgi:hypothetical protein
LSADALARRLDKVSDMLASRPPRRVQGVSDFQVARSMAFVIARGRRPGSSPQEAEHAEALADVLGLPKDWGSTGYKARPFTPFDWG